MNIKLCDNSDWCHALLLRLPVSQWILCLKRDVANLPKLCSEIELMFYL